MEMKYKPTKPQKVKPAKPAKPTKPAKPAKAAPMGVGAAQSVKIEKPKIVKAPKAPKAPKPEKAKAISFGKPGKVQTADKPIKVGKAGKMSGLFEKVDPKIILGAALAVIAIVAVVVVTVVLPAAEKRGQQIKKIEITQEPAKLTYVIGEEADYDGLRVTVTRNNGETFVVRASKCEITGFRSDIATENRLITVEYEGHYATFEVEIIELTQPKPALKGIRLDSMPKTQYKMGEPLDVSGTYLILEYVDGSTDRTQLLRSDVYGFGDVNGPGSYKLTVQYIENGIAATTTYTITVTK